MSEECRYCGFPLSNENERCITCLSPRFRKIVGRYNPDLIEKIVEASSVNLHASTS